MGRAAKRIFPGFALTGGERYRDLRRRLVGTASASLFLLTLGFGACVLFEKASGYGVKLNAYHECLEDCMASRAILEEDCGCKRPSETRGREAR